MGGRKKQQAKGNEAGPAGGANPRTTQEEADLAFALKMQADFDREEKAMVRRTLRPP